VAKQSALQREGMIDRQQPARPLAAHVIRPTAARSGIPYKAVGLALAIGFSIAVWALVFWAGGALFSLFASA
jgi:hypothetical protein